MGCLYSKVDNSIKYINPLTILDTYDTHRTSMMVFPYSNTRNIISLNLQKIILKKNNSLYYKRSKSVDSKTPEPMYRSISTWSLNDSKTP